MTNGNEHAAAFANGLRAFVLAVLQLALGIFVGVWLCHALLGGV